MFEYVTNLFKENNKKKMGLWCVKENIPAITFYEKKGGVFSKEKKFTIEGARNQLIEDAGNLAEKNNSSDLILQINEIRGELLETYLLVKKYSSSQNSLENKT